MTVYRNRLSFLIEGELEKAEVVLAAKSITDAIQKMAETAAKIESDDLMPLNDPIRDQFGADVAATFSEEATNKVRELVKFLGDTKNALSDAIAKMQGQLDGSPQGDLATMGDDEIGDGASGDGQNDLSDDQFSITGDDAKEQDSDVPDSDQETDTAPQEPKFDDDGAGALKAAGRLRKESAAPRGKMLESNPDKRIALEYVGLIREGKSPKTAARRITESYGMTINDLIDIVSAAKSK